MPLLQPLVAAFRLVCAVTPSRAAANPGIKRVPLIAAGARPAVFFAGRPTAEWAADARWSRRAGVLLLLKLAVWNNDRIVRDRIHARYYDPHPDLNDSRM